MRSQQWLAGSTKPPPEPMLINSLAPGRPVVSFTKEVHPRLAKRPLVFNGRLANRGLTSLVKEATGCNFKTAIFKLVLLIGIFISSKDNALR